MRRMRFFFYNLFIAICAIIFVIYFANKTSSVYISDDKNRFKYWKSTVCQITKTGYGKSGGYGIVKFTVNRVTYHEEIPFSKPILGNCYMIYYDSIDPSLASTLNKAEPVKLTSYYDSMTFAYDVDIDKDTTSYGFHFVTYKYRYKDKEFEGNRYIKHSNYRQTCLDSLVVTYNSYFPSSSYLSWPFEKELICITRKGKLELWKY